MLALFLAFVIGAAAAGLFYLAWLSEGVGDGGAPFFLAAGLFLSLFLAVLLTRLGWWGCQETKTRSPPSFVPHAHVMTAILLIVLGIFLSILLHL